MRPERNYNSKSISRTKKTKAPLNKEKKIK